MRNSLLASANEGSWGMGVAKLGVFDKPLYKSITHSQAFAKLSRLRCFSFCLPAVPNTLASRRKRDIPERLSGLIFLGGLDFLKNRALANGRLRLLLGRGPARRKEIQEAARRLGYQPNTTAKALARFRRDSIRRSRLPPRQLKVLAGVNRQGNLSR